jgi:hypothetical protein
MNYQKNDALKLMIHKWNLYSAIALGVSFSRETLQATL